MTGNTGFEECQHVVLQESTCAFITPAFIICYTAFARQDLWLSSMLPAVKLGGTCVIIIIMKWGLGRPQASATSTIMHLSGNTPCPRQGREGEMLTIMGLCAAPRKTSALASEARAPLRLALSLGSPCTPRDLSCSLCKQTDSQTDRLCRSHSVAQKF